MYSFLHPPNLSKTENVVLLVILLTLLSCYKLNRCYIKLSLVNTCSLRYCLKCYFSKGVYSFTLSTVYGSQGFSIMLLKGVVLLLLLVPIDLHSFFQTMEDNGDQQLNENYPFKGQFSAEFSSKPNQTQMKQLKVYQNLSVRCVLAGIN